jgi:hypothetical protein
MHNIGRKIGYSLLFVAIAAVCLPAASAQDDSSSSSGAPPAATAPPERNVENPPLSGLDAPASVPVFGGRSYLVPGLQFSETVDSNAAGTSGNRGTVGEISRGLVSVDLQKLWRSYQLGLDYIGGGDVYTGPRVSSHGGAYQVHTLAADQRVLWRTGQLSFRDSFDFLPEGTFGFSSYGGAGSFGSALGNGVSGVGAGAGLGGGIAGGSPAGLYGGNAGYGSIGFEPRISNSTIVDIAQEFSPRTSVTLGGSYDWSHYLDKAAAPFPIVDSQQTTGQVGFNRLLSRRDQIGLLYAFQDFHFPLSGSGTVNAHVWNVLYGHRVTGRLNLTLGGGPQLVIVHNPLNSIQYLLQGPSTQRVSANGTLTLAYTVSTRTSVRFMYQRYITPGSGFYAGANTNAARLSVGRLFGRHWTTATDLGYSLNSRLQSSTTSGVNSKSYQYWYAGSSLRRQIGRQFGVFVTYQYNDIGLSQCSSGVCSSSSQRHTGMIGIDWHPKPVRLD